MSKRVKTPCGEKEVLTPDELEDRIQNRDMTRYQQKDNGGWYCNACGCTILLQKIPHPIWDGPFSCSGSGKCFYEDVPYCPECEEIPNFEGEPIIPKGSYHNP